MFHVSPLRAALITDTFLLVHPSHAFRSIEWDGRPLDKAMFNCSLSFRPAFILCLTALDTWQHMNIHLSLVHRIV